MLKRKSINEINKNFVRNFDSKIVIKNNKNRKEQINERNRKFKN